MAKSASVKQTKSSITMTALYRWNKWLAVLHGVQAIVVFLLASTRIFPVQTSYLTPDPIASELQGNAVVSMASRHLFDINLAYLVVAFFAIASIAHLLIATAYRSRYEVDLKQGVNKMRWIEYAFSASTMMVAIAVLSGIADLSTLLMIFALGVIMHLAGLAMEIYSKGKAELALPAYIIGFIAGIVPWIVFGIYIWATTVYGGGSIPGFVYGIYATMLVLCFGFAANMYLQYKKVGKWKDYLYGERVYMILSLVAKTALAWQIFAGALRL
jgi:hypothetical protein